MAHWTLKNNEPVPEITIQFNPDKLKEYANPDEKWDYLFSISQDILNEWANEALKSSEKKSC